jgi:hypothetical protein
MTKEELIRMAREAGIPIETDWAGRPATLVIKDGGTYLRGIEDLERFAALVAEHEREACAKLCDEFAAHCWAKDDAVESMIYEECAAAIRARGQK